MALTTTTYGYTKERSGEARPVSPDIAAVEPGSLTFEINHMDLFYGDHHALKDVSMDIRTHEITALIGPSGCGKSTFLKSPVTSGSKAKTSSGKWTCWPCARG